jgi:2-dehydro-3-deoxyphosphogluconate aldolase/(4S)-4-hydroxy-2-oxoglutarate aldolase
MSELILSRLRQTGVVAIVRGVDGDVLPTLAEALYAGGVRLLEVTLNTKGALQSIAQLAAAFGDRMSIGAGTVLTEEAARQAQAHGAQFFVTPHVGQDVIAYGVRMGIPVMAGAMTPTEIYTAHVSGASAVKVFPVGTLGAGYLREVRGPFDKIPLLAVGGVTLANAQSFLAAGAIGWGLGGGLLDKQALAAGDFAKMTQNAKAFIDVYHRFTQMSPHPEN